MVITIEVAGWFKRFTGGRSELELELKDGTNALEAVCAAGIPREEVGFVTVSNKDSAESKLIDDQYVPLEGDVLKVYPLLIGG